MFECATAQAPGRRIIFLLRYVGTRVFEQLQCLMQMPRQFVGRIYWRMLVEVFAIVD